MLYLKRNNGVMACPSSTEWRIPRVHNGQQNVVLFASWRMILSDASNNDTIQSVSEMVTIPIINSDCTGACIGTTIVTCIIIAL